MGVNSQGGSAETGIIANKLLESVENSYSVEPQAEISFVIPVFNGARTITAVVERIFEFYSDLEVEIVLVNDGSGDDSESVCLALQEEHPRGITYVQLARNFGEHNAVLAGLSHSTGSHVAVLDDDGQNPPEEVRRMYDELRSGGWDVVYGRYRAKQHSALRNLGSAFNDRVANLMLNKPRDLYLSSFKVMNRFVADEITRYRGSFPYIDGLILRTTCHLGQVDVDHQERAGAESNYTIRRLFLLWLNMFLNFSIMPLRFSALLGACMSIASFFLMIAIVIDKLYVNPDVSVGIPTVLVTVAFFAGVQLLILGTVGEYLGRIFMDQSGTPQSVVRYTRERELSRD
jgi:glycosyltransferase involved in cell wall biosynthesis